MGVQQRGLNPTRTGRVAIRARIRSTHLRRGPTGQGSADGPYGPLYTLDLLSVGLLGGVEPGTLCGDWKGCSRMVAQGGREARRLTWRCARVRGAGRDPVAATVIVRRPTGGAPRLRDTTGLARRTTDLLMLLADDWGAVALDVRPEADEPAAALVIGRGAGQGDVCGPAAAVHADRRGGSGPDPGPRRGSARAFFFALGAGHPAYAEFGSGTGVNIVAALNRETPRRSFSTRTSFPTEIAHLLGQAGMCFPIDTEPCSRRGAWVVLIVLHWLWGHVARV